MAADTEAQRSGKSIDQLKAEEGMKLFEQEAGAKVEYDVPAATKFAAEWEASIKEMEEEVKTLTGKENKKAQTEKKKAISAAKNDPKYIDATKVVKGLEPKNGNFIKSKTEAPKKAENKGGYAAPEVPKVEEKKEEKKEDKKPKKKEESAGISKDERAELEDLKNKIIARKSELKAQGMSGGQQNKDSEVAAMVNRMNELKEKECPGSTQKAGKDKGASKKKGALSSEEQKAMDDLKVEIEQYRERLTKEFGYSKKEITADPDMQDLQEKLKAFEKRA